MTQKHIAILCGGQSPEHEVSLESAKNIFLALNKDHYKVSIIVITQTGQWLLLDSPDILLHNKPMHPLAEPFASKLLCFQFGQAHPIVYSKDQTPIEIDLIFPIIHGAHGEDGKLQGLLEMANLPYVGCGVMSSAVCMDKDVSKRLLKQANIPVANWITVTPDQVQDLSFKEVIEQLGLPFFVKPANTGSSVGVSKVKHELEFKDALTYAQKYDHKILLETYIAGREIECSVLGNAHPEASLPGEIIPHAEFYSYDAKYLNAEGATLETPANLPKDMIEQIQTLAKQVFIVLNCEGMARIDFFLTPQGQLFVNEPNTLPGFTQISQYPNMWRVSGLAYSDLLEKLIELALERFKN